MTNIDVNCIYLKYLTYQDIDFLVSNNGNPQRHYKNLMKLVYDSTNSLEDILSSKALQQKVLDQSEIIISISPFLLFSILLRRAIPGPYSKTDTFVLNYLANVLAQFGKTNNLYKLFSDDDDHCYHLADMRQREHDSSAREKVEIQMHIGNYTLFMCGIFNRFIDCCHRYKRRPLRGSDYADLGRSNYLKAASSELAKRNHLSSVLMKLAIEYDKYRIAFTKLSREIKLSPE